MIITCNTIQELLEEIETQVKEHGNAVVYQLTIRVSISKRPLADSAHTKPRDVVRWEVELQASALVDLGEQGQYLVQVGESCGIDYHDNSQEMGGTIEADRLKAIVKSFCDSYGLRIGPGTIQV